MGGRRDGGRTEGRMKRGIDIVMSNEPTTTSLVLAHGVVETSIGRIRNLRKKIFIVNDEL